MRLRPSVAFVLALSALSRSDALTAGVRPVLQYDSPSGFTRSTGTPEGWVANSLDGVIHVYPFRPFPADFVDEFHRTLFREWISALYREDKRLDDPNFKPLTVKGSEAAIAASFRSFNGGAPREHLRVAIIVSGHVALVDMSANSPQAFERNAASFSRLVSSLRIVDRGSSARRPPDK